MAALLQARGKAQTDWQLASAALNCWPVNQQNDLSLLTYLLSAPSGVNE